MYRVQNEDPEMANEYREAITKVEEVSARLSQVYPVLQELWSFMG